MTVFDVRAVSSLEKIFIDEPQLDVPAVDHIEGLAGETVSFQLAYRYAGDTAAMRQIIPAGAANPSHPVMCVRVRGAFADCVRIRQVESVPVTFPAYQQVDDGYISTRPGLYPDLLRDIDGRVSNGCTCNGRVSECACNERVNNGCTNECANEVKESTSDGGPDASVEAVQVEVETIAMPNQWRSLWIDIELPNSTTQSSKTQDSVTSTNGNENDAALSEGESEGIERDDTESVDGTLSDTDGRLSDTAPLCSPRIGSTLRPTTMEHSGTLTFEIADVTGTVVHTVNVNVNVIEQQLPEQRLIFTEWLYADCLAEYYSVPVFSEEHWHILEQFVRTAVRRGVTMMLTPLFTPPLDTLIGGERLTTQLIGVRRNGDTWEFDFTLLERWVTMCQAAGVRQFEMSHLFTQWGAAHPPKIVAEVNGEMRRVFGWEYSATDERDGYPAFLRSLLPQLDRELHRLGIADRTYFHISDEPHAEHLESYLAAKRLVAPLIVDYPIIDALSDIAYWRQGVCDRPVPCEDTVQDFIDDKVPGLWTYYCCAQNIDVPNRFMSMPSWRNRILGFLLFKYDMAGFLHWGYNFYNTAHSTRAINPYVETGAGDSFPAGDSFAVYPGEGGAPEESIRLMVMYEALCDLRACQLLESMIGHDAVVSLLEDGLDTPLTFREYPHDAQWLLGRREAVNTAIRSHSAQ